MIHLKKDISIIDNMIIVGRGTTAIKIEKDTENKFQISNNLIINNDEDYSNHYKLAMANTFLKRIVFAFRLVFKFKTAW